MRGRADLPIAPLSDSTRAEIARKRVGYVLSPAGRETLAGHGFVRIDAT